MSWSRLATGVPVLQTRQLGENGPSPAETTLLIDDERTPGPAQMRLSDFLSVVQREVCSSLEQVLSAAGRTTANCPYLNRLFPFLERQSASTAERILRRFAPELVNPPSALSYVPFIVERARASTLVWLDTGEITGLPAGLPSSLDALTRGVSGLGALALDFKAKTGGANRDRGPEAVQSQLGNGQPLAGPVRGWMESAFGTSFSDVRIHTDGSAAALSSELNAHAFTVGADVAFGAGEYRPGTISGDALLAHELAHVVQQRGVGGAQTGDPETAADQAALAVFEGREPRAGSVGGLQLQRCDVVGSGYEPTETEEYHREPPTPDEMIAQHTTVLGDLDEDELGATLAQMAWYTPRHHDFIRRVFEALDSGDRDDVAAAMIARTQDSDLADIARTEEGRALLTFIVPELTEGWTWPGGDTYAAVRALRALRAQQAATNSVSGELDDMRRAVGAARAPADIPVEVLSQTQIEERLRLVEVQLRRFEASFGRDTEVMAAVTAVRTRLGTARSNIQTQAPDISRSVQIAQQILETCELMITELGRQIAVLESELRRRGTEEANIELLRFVRDRFIESLGAALGPEAPLKFAQAGAALQQLSLSQAEIELSVLQHRPGLFSAVETKLERLRSFATWTISELNALEVESLAVQEAERAGTDTTARRAAARQRLEKVALSQRILANWEVVIEVAEALESGFSFTETFYGHGVDVDSIHNALLLLSQHAQAGNLELLRRELERFESDQRIRAYYEDVPSILKSSGIVVAIGVMIAAALVTWGVGSIFAAPAGAAAGGTAAGTTAVAAGTTGTITAGTIAAAAGTNLLNALVFTSVHRGLATATNVGVSGSFFEDLLWNFGLFSVLRVASFGVRAGLQARGLAHLVGRVQFGTAFGLLETYGVARFWIEEGRLPTGREFASMTAQTVVILAALLVTHSVVQRFSALGRFQARWGSEFEAIRQERHALEQDAQRALAEGRTDTFEAELRTRARALETRFRELIDRVIAEGNVEALRTELGSAAAMEASQAALTESMGLLPETAIRPAGTPNTFSYRHGETSRLTEGLRGLNPADVRVIEPESGGRARVVEVRFNDRPSLSFVERAAEQAPVPPAQPPVSPAEQNARALEAAKESLTRRRIPWSEVPEDLRGLQSALPRGQSRTATIERTAALLRRLEAWIADRPETPWQLGREARIQMPSDTAQAHVAGLPEGPLRQHLQGNTRAAIIFGALRETAPATAASRMQAIWEAWLRTNQEQSFAEFADSSLVEAGVAALEAASEPALANLLKSEGAVQNAFARLGYDVARLRAVYLYHQHGYGAGLNFADYSQHEVGSLQGEGRSWGERRGRLAASIPAAGFEPLRTRLGALTAGGTLTDVDAGIVWRWNAAIEAIINRSASRVPGAEASSTRSTAVLNHLLEGLGRNFSESAYRTFRHRVRALMVDDVVFMREGGDSSGSPGTRDGTPVRPWADQSARLTDWEGRVPQGDSGSIGALWTAYARARFELGLPTGSTAAGIQSVPGRNLRMSDGRMADDVLQFGRRADPSAPSRGEHAADYKGGADPFDADQARNYSDNMYANGGSFTMGGRTYQGLLLIFRNGTAADTAARTLNGSRAHSNLKVGYFSSTTGAIVWVR